MLNERYNAKNHTKIREHIKKTGAIDLINNEFSTWELLPYEEKSGCGSCAAK